MTHRSPDPMQPECAACGKQEPGTPDEPVKLAECSMCEGPMTGRRNDTVELVRSLTTPARKRGGARYGPAPKREPHERMQAPKPMSFQMRMAVYADDRTPGRRGFTDRQERQLCLMSDRLAHAEGLTRFSGKGRPTPKRKASR